MERFDGAGGGRGSVVQRSLKLECPRAHMAKQPGSNSRTEKSGLIGLEKFRIPLAHQV